MPYQSPSGMNANVDLGPVAMRDLVALLRLMAVGEQIATECARWQARVAANPRDRRFFRAQTGHERLHAWLFQSAAQVLNPAASVPRPLLGIMSEYRQRLDAAISGNGWLEVLIGQQLVLENLGEVVLQHLDDNMTRRKLGLTRLRKQVIRQEQAHHRYGMRLLDAEVAAGRADRATLRRLAGPYLELTDRLLTRAAPLLESLDANAEEYRHEFWTGLPDWANGRAHDLGDHPCSQ